MNGFLITPSKTVEARRNGGEAPLSDKIKVVVVDDQRFARMYVDMYIANSPRFELLASLPYASDVLSYLKENDADMLILDVLMERGIDGMSAAAEIKKSYPDIKIILATSLADPEWMAKAREIGVESFWYKEYSKTPLIEIMERTANGESVYDDELPEVYLGALPVSELTSRQKTLLCLLVEGLTNKEIAERMYLSVNTVKSYLDDIMNSSGIHSRTELAVRSSKLGLASGDVKK